MSDDPVRLLDKNASRIRLDVDSETAEIRYRATSPDGLAYARSARLALPKAVVDMLFAAANDVLVAETARARDAAIAHQTLAADLASREANVAEASRALDGIANDAHRVHEEVLAAHEKLADERAQHDRAVADFASHQENVKRQLSGIEKREAAVGEQAKHVEETAARVRQMHEELAQRERVLELKIAENEAREATIEAQKIVIAKAAQAVGA